MDSTTRLRQLELLGHSSSDERFSAINRLYGATLVATTHDPADWRELAHYTQFELTTFIERLTKLVGPDDPALAVAWHTRIWLTNLPVDATGDRVLPPFQPAVLERLGRLLSVLTSAIRWRPASKKLATAL